MVGWYFSNVRHLKSVLLLPVQTLPVYLSFDSPSSNVHLVYSNGENVATATSNLFTPRAYLAAKGITLNVGYQAVSFPSG